jgi:Protein of unknown function (DUF3305)
LSGEVFRISVGVVVERRKAKSDWVDFIWLPVSVLAGIPSAEPWTKLKEDDRGATFYAGATDVELHATQTTYYRDNLASGEPSLWVVLRLSNGPSPYELFKVTADPSEGEAMTEAGADVVETVAMPGVIREQIAAFIARYHVEHPFIKRERDRANPEAISRKSIVKENKR